MMKTRSTLVMLAALALASAKGAQAQTTFTVNDPADAVDIAPGDSVCQTSVVGRCSLRAAVMEANALPGDDTIRFDPLLNGMPIILTIPAIDGCPPFGCFNEADDTTGDVDIMESLTIVGNGPANTILQGGPDADSAVDRVLEIISRTSAPITTVISGVTIRNSGGVIEHGGLAISRGAATTTISDSVIRDNRGSGIDAFFGGGIFLDRVTVSGNRAERGGGFFVEDAVFLLSITNSTFSGNTAIQRGGGLYLEHLDVNTGDELQISNSTFSGNVAAEGCAVYNASGLLQVHDVTIAGNCSAGSGSESVLTGAVGEGVGTTLLRNTILASPIGALNCRTSAGAFGTGSFATQGYNLLSDASCALAAVGDVQNVDPLLAALGNNGGPTQTHLLLPGSPAIDSGSPTDCPAADQTGGARPTDGDGNGVATCDKGSLEVAAGTPPTGLGIIRGSAWDDIDGDGVRAGELGYGGLPICVFPTSPLVCVATLANGTFELTSLAAGTYYVYERLPLARMNTTPRTRTVNVSAGGIVTGVDFGSRVPPPPPPAWSLPVVSQAFRKNSFFFVRVTAPCVASAVTATVQYAGVPPESRSMAYDAASNTWLVAFLTPGGPGYLPLTIVADCSPLAYVGFIQFVDPSGTILDACTGQPLAGAAVALQKNEPFGSEMYVTPDPTEHIPGINPELTTGDGVYGWDVVPGRYRVQASKPGYGTVVTDAFDVPPPKLALDITLMRTAGCNVAPVAHNDAYVTNQGASLTIAAPGVLTNDTDANGNALTAVLVSPAAHGTVTLLGNGSFTYVPAAAFHGSDVFTYKANDGTDDSNVATVTISIKATNRLPVAADDSYATPQDKELVVSAPGVLRNDRDADGDTLSASLVAGPRHGSLTLRANGSFRYRPNRGFVGIERFTYKASDGVLRSNTATVSIDVTRNCHDGH